MIYTSVSTLKTYLKTMTTQVIFKIDKKLKDQAMKKAQSEGLPFGMVLKLATKAFNVTSSKTINKALKDIKNGKNLSPRFTTTEEAVAYLKS